MHINDVETTAPHSSAQDLSDRDLRIMTAQKRAASSMRDEPEGARSTTATMAHVGAGLTCRIQQGKFDAVADLGPGMGGDAAGPSPSFYGRAAIASCVAIAIKMLAATEGKTFRAVDVTVETDFDDGALFGIGPSTAAPLETRIAIQIESDEDASEVSKIVSTALARDPWYLALRHAQAVTTTLDVEGISLS